MIDVQKARMEMVLSSELGRDAVQLMLKMKMKLSLLENAKQEVFEQLCIA